jgi:hypothetical protein
LHWVATRCSGDAKAITRLLPLVQAFAARVEVRRADSLNVHPALVPRAQKASAAAAALAGYRPFGSAVAVAFGRRLFFCAVS